VRRFVVLLRGINVGTARRVAMADLRALLADAGYGTVRTVLNSGNVVLDGEDGVDAEDHRTAVERAIADRTGLDVPCTVLSAEELRAVVAGNPFAEVAAAAEKGGSRLVAHVLRAPEPDPAALAEAVALDPERTAAGPRVLYQWCPDGLLQAPPVTAPVHPGVTTRTWNTVERLAGLL
jgi:uncharacterized protein (DUF1697 family)